MLLSSQKIITLFVLIVLMCAIPLHAESNSASEQDNGKATETLFSRYYHRLYPDIVTNLQFNDRAVYMQTRVEILTDDEKKVAIIEHHAPLLRDQIIQTFNLMSAQELDTPEKIEVLRKKVVIMVSNVLKRVTDEDLVRDVLFTRFIIE